MKNIIKYSFIALATAICIGFFASCNDDDDLGSPDRLFRPQIIENGQVVGETFIELTWARYKGAEKYDVEISVDSFATFVEKVQTDTVSYKFENLESDTKYQLRIRSIGNNISSDYLVLKDITTNDVTTLLATPSAADLLDTQIRVLWTDASYTELRVYNGNVLVTTVPLTAADNEQKAKIISKLAPNKTYVVKAYTTVDNKEVYKGKKTFKTVPAQTFTGDVVDLRDKSAEESLNLITKAYVEELSTLYPAGVTILLKGGVNYNIKEETLISSSIDFVTGLSFDGYAIMSIDASFGVAASTSVGSVKFEKIFFTEGLTKKRGTSADNFGGTYVFNFNKSGGNLDKLTFESCMIKYKRSVTRVQTTATINTFTMNNCVVDSIGDFAVIHSGNDNAYIRDIKVSNSTFSNAKKLFVGGGKLGINSISVEKITTCYAPASGNTLFDYAGNKIPGGVTIKKCVFGKSISGSVNGIKSAATEITLSENYRASDLNWSMSAGENPVPNFPIDNLINTGVKSDVLFKDAAKSDFTVTNTAIRGSEAGDPRWLK